MLTLSTHIFQNQEMAQRAARPQARATGRRSGPRRTVGKAAYHHGDLPRALVAEAVRTIQKDGVAALTLRGVGEQVGVSRTALYRHFANKDALLAAVAGEGFRMLRQALQEAWLSGGEGRGGFEAMGEAYIQFAVQHPSHYRVMFGNALDQATMPHAHASTGEGDAFGSLVNAVLTLQRKGGVRQDDARMMSLYIWSVVHGVAMLAIDGILADPTVLGHLTRYAIDRISTGIALPSTATGGS